MKHMKPLVATALALSMAFAPVTPAFAYEGDTHADNTNSSSFAGVADNAISITGLSEDDQVKFYKILDYDQDASTKIADLTSSSDVTKGAAGWKVISPFATGADAITGTDLKAILTTGITSELAGKIAKNATGTATWTETANEEGKAEKTKPGAGLYVAIVVPQNAGVMYNPIFVASDYYTTGPDDLSSTWEPVVSPLSYSDKGMAKKSTIKVTKTAAEASEATNETNGAKAVGKGDTVNFTVNTTIPEFADNYTKPLFVVSDTVTNGLDITKGSVKVYDSKGTEIAATTGTRVNYTITYKAEESPITSYKVMFGPEYLLSLEAATEINIKYDAVVTEDAVENVNVEENTVTVEYSHEPSVNEEGKGKKVGDKTHHYSFTIDGNIWGDSTYKTTEVVKVGIDKDGNEIEQTTTLSNDKTIGALSGAEFKLYTNAACTNEYAKGNYAAATATDDGNKIVSDSEGRLMINGTTTGISGLDAGEYWLKEEKAPAGYIKQQTATHIEIIPTYYGEVTWTENGIEITSDDILKSYIVKIDGQQTAEYVLNYDMDTARTLPLNDVAKEDTNNMKTTHNDVVIGNTGPITTVANEKQDSDAYGKIQNIQGTELPSTGGMGTTILYTVGGIMVVGAGLYLLTKKRVNSIEA